MDGQSILDVLNYTHTARFLLLSQRVLRDLQRPISFSPLPLDGVIIKVKSTRQRKRHTIQEMTSLQHYDLMYKKWH